MSTTETFWLRTTETLLGASFETYLTPSIDVLIRCFCYVLLRRRHEVPIKRHGGILLRHLGDVPPRRRWMFHLRLSATSLGLTQRRHCDVATTTFCRMEVLSFFKQIEIFRFPNICNICNR